MPAGESSGKTEAQQTSVALAGRLRVARCWQSSKSHSLVNQSWGLIISLESRRQPRRLLCAAGGRMQGAQVKVRCSSDSLHPVFFLLLWWRAQRRAVLCSLLRHRFHWIKCQTRTYRVASCWHMLHRQIKS